MSVCLRRLRCIAPSVQFNATRTIIRLHAVAVRSYSTPTNSDDPIDESLIPTRIDRSYETSDVTRARLLYQSRKRGILETDLLLSTFADKYLPSMSSEELNEYDAVCKMSIPRLMRQQLLDEPDWEIYYWATGKKPTPPEWIDSEILASLKQHVKNEGKVILRMPDLQGKSK